LAGSAGLDSFDLAKIFKVELRRTIEREILASLLANRPFGTSSTIHHQRLFLSYYFVTTCIIIQSYVGLCIQEKYSMIRFMNTRQQVPGPARLWGAVLQQTADGHKWVLNITGKEAICKRTWPWEALSS